MAGRPRNKAAIQLGAGAACLCAAGILLTWLAHAEVLSFSQASTFVYFRFRLDVLECNGPHEMGCGLRASQVNKNASGAEAGGTGTQLYGALFRGLRPSRSWWCHTSRSSARAVVATLKSIRPGRGCHIRRGPVTRSHRR